MGARSSASRISKSFQKGTLSVLCFGYGEVVWLSAKGREAWLVQSTTMFSVWRKRRFAWGLRRVNEERRKGGGVRSRL